MDFDNLTIPELLELIRKITEALEIKGNLSFSVVD